MVRGEATVTARRMPPPAEPIIRRVCDSCGLRRATYNGATPRGWTLGPSGAYFCGWCSNHPGKRRPKR